MEIVLNFNTTTSLGENSVRKMEFGGRRRRR
jgi:hypothetical protein